MTRTPLFKQPNKIMRVAGFLSGTGSNIQKIIEYERNTTPRRYNVVMLFSDNERSNAMTIGEKYDIPVVVHDIKNFYRSHGVDWYNLANRHLFDEETRQSLAPLNIDIITLAGYMSMLSNEILHHYLCINVHPANLTILENEKRKYTGTHPVRDAIRSGERELRSTTHIVNEGMDAGQIIMISNSIPVRGDWSIEQHERQLKEMGDWLIFPKTLELIAQGKIMTDENKNLYFNNKPIPEGIQYNEL